MKRRQMVARSSLDRLPGTEDSMEIWHAVFSTAQANDDFLKDLEKFCVKHDIRMVLTEQKKQ